MTLENPSSEPLDTDLVAEPEAQEPHVVTKDEALIALQSRDRSAFDTWYVQQMEATDRDPTSGLRFQVTIEAAKLLFTSGDKEGALELLFGANTAVTNELVELDTPGSTLDKLPDKEAYAKKLKEILKQVLYYRDEYRRSGLIL